MELPKVSHATRFEAGLDASGIHFYLHPNLNLNTFILHYVQDVSLAPDMSFPLVGGGFPSW